MKKYTVILMVPDDCENFPDTTMQHVTCNTREQAVRLAKMAACRENDMAYAERSDDYRELYLFSGHLEAL